MQHGHGNMDMNDWNNQWDNKENNNEHYNDHDNEHDMDHHEDKAWICPGPRICGI